MEGAAVAVAGKKGRREDVLEGKEGKRDTKEMR